MAEPFEALPEDHLPVAEFPRIYGIRYAQADFSQDLFRPDEIASILYNKPRDYKEFVESYRLHYYILKGDPDPVARAFDW